LISKGEKMNSLKDFCKLLFYTILAEIAYMIGSHRLIDWVMDRKVKL